MSFSGFPKPYFEIPKSLRVLITATRWSVSPKPQELTFLTKSNLYNYTKPDKITIILNKTFFRDKNQRSLNRTERSVKLETQNSWGNLTASMIRKVLSTGINKKDVT